MGHKDAGIPLADKDGYRGEAIGTALFVFEAKAGAGTPKGTTSLAGAQATFPLPADEVKVPKLTGLALREAVAKLKERNLQATHPEGASLAAPVTEQDPASGWLAPGKSVRLTVRKPTPDKPVRPDPKKPPG